MKIGLLINTTAGPDETLGDAEQELRAELKGHDIRVAHRIFTRDAVDTPGTYLGDVVELTQAILPIVAGVLVAWLGARKGRKVRLKLNDQVEVEAQTPEDVAKLLQIAQRYIDASKDGPHDEN